MSKALVAVIVSVFLGAGTLRSQSLDAGVLAPVGVTAGQTLRFNVTARTAESCVAQLGFLDSDGRSVGSSSSVSLKAGESAHLDLPSSAVVTKSGQRTEIKPRIVPAAAIAASACQTSVSVLDSPAERNAEANPAGGTKEGIQVHGHWTIDVRNPDGTLASHREFENSLTAGGAFSLIRSLAGNIVLGLLQVGLAPPAAQPGLCSAGSCFLEESAEPSSGTNIFHTLTVSLPSTGVYSGDTVLTGSFSAPQAGLVGAVSTYTDICPAGTSSCSLATPGSTNSDFTGTTLTPAISVAAGQIVQVTVAIGFM